MKKFYLGVAMAITLASCTNEELVNSKNETKLEATVESVNVDSRVGFDKSNSWSFFWHNGDKIWVNESPMSTTDADGSKSATFKGYGVNTSSGYAVYPYEKAEKNVDGTLLTWTFPEEYSYTDVDGNFFESSQDVPMYAKVVNGSASFKHLGAIVAFKFNDWTFKGEHVFTLTASNKITGKFTTDLSGEVPLLESSVKEEDVVTVKYTRPKDATANTVLFYVPIPTGTYEYLRVKLTVDGETQFVKTSKSKTVKRGDIVWAEIGESSLVGDNKDYKAVDNIGDIDETILSTSKEDLTVQVTEEVSGNDNVIELPAALNTATTTFLFSSIADNAEITIKNEDGGKYVGQVIIEVPENETIPTVNAIIPDGEVYIKQGNVTKLVVSSADNTTIIGVNAEIGTLVVEKGNVRIEDGGKIVAIQRSSANKDALTYVIYEGDTKPALTIDGENIILVSAAEWDLRKAIAAGSSVTLDADIDLVESIVVTKDLTVNLNNKSIKCASSDVFVVTSGTLTINGDGLVYGSEDNSSSSCAVWAKGTGKVVINGGTYKVGDDTSNGKTGNWRNDCIYAKEQASIEINGGEFMYTGENPAGHTFLLNLKDSDGATLVVKGGKFHKFNPAASNGENPVANFVAAGYSAVAEGNSYVVKEGIYNEVALKAVAALGGKAVLQADITLSSSVDVAADMTVVLNNHKITHPADSPVDWKEVFFVKASGVLIIEGVGEVISEAGYSVNAAGNVTLNGGYYYSTVATVVAYKNANVTINGGEYFVDPAKNPDPADGEKYGYDYNLNILDNYLETAKIVVKGGSFYKFNPAASNGENPVANFVAEGYISVKSDNDWYIVSPLTNADSGATTENMTVENW